MSKRSSKTKGSVKNSASWLNEAEEVPSEAGMKYTRRTFTAKTWKNLMLVALWLLPLSFLGNVVSLSSLLEEDAPPTVQDTNTSPNKAIAMEGVSKWLKSEPSPVPGGTLLSWDSVSVLSQQGFKRDNSGAITENTPGLEIHHLTVIQGNGVIFDTAVQIAASDTTGAKVIAAPSLTPRIPDSTSVQNVPEPWPGLTKATVTEHMTKSATMFAQALFSSDPAALRLAIGDTSEANNYMPMPKATVSNVSVDMAAAADPKFDPSSGLPPKTVIARITVGVNWPDIELDGKAAPSMAYDVLMTGADAGAPRVVAWGPTGAGASLTEFGNAQTNRKITSSDSAPVEAPDKTKNEGK